MKDVLRVGMIGLGKAGLRHAAAIGMCDDAIVVAAADPSPTAKSAAADHEIQHFDEYEEMLDEVAMDAVIVSLPHSMLYDAAMLVASYRRHLLLEKPMALSVDEGQRIVNECRAADLRLMVNFAHRFRTECRQASATIRAGTIGQPVMAVDVMGSGASDLPGWVWDPKVAGGGMMMYNGIHSVDRLAWLMASPICSVSAASGTFSYDVKLEDNLAGTLTFDNGTIGAVLQHKSNANATIRGWQTLVYGTRGALRISGENSLEVVAAKENNGLMVSGDNHFLGAFYEFAEAIQQDRDPVPSGDDGVHALRVVLALYEAATTKTVVPVGNQS